MVELRERELVDICEKDPFVKYLVGNVYCSLALGSRKIQCPHLSEEYDYNDIRPCLNPIYQLTEKQ